MNSKLGERYLDINPKPYAYPPPLLVQLFQAELSVGIFDTPIAGN